MRSFFSIAAIFLLSLTTIFFPWHASQAATPGKFVGTWVPISYSFVGEEKPQNFLDHTKLTLKGDGSGVSTVNGMQQKGTWQVDNNVLTFMLSLGGRQIPVEYIIDDNRLKIDNAVTKAVFKKK